METRVTIFRVEGNDISHTNSDEGNYNGYLFIHS